MTVVHRPRRRRPHTLLGALATHRRGAARCDRRSHDRRRARLHLRERRQARLLATGLRALGIGQAMPSGRDAQERPPVLRRRSRRRAARCRTRAALRHGPRRSRSRTSQPTPSCGRRSPRSRSCRSSSRPRGPSQQCPAVCLEPRVAGTVPWDELAGGAPLSRAHEPSPDDLLTIIYTRHHGPSKGVELTHGALMAATDAVAEFAALHEGGRVISWLPLAHNRRAHRVVLRGRRLRARGGRLPDAKEVAATCPQVQPSFFFAVPRFWEKLAHRDRGEGRRPARGGAAGRSPRAPGARRRHPPTRRLRRAEGRRDRCGPERSAARRVLPRARRCRSARSTGSPSRRHAAPQTHAGQVRIGSAGLPMPGMEVRLADDGEVETRGPALIARLRGQPEQTAAAFTAVGWLRTGDVGRFDEDGYLWIFDRKKDVMISAGGEHVAVQHRVGVQVRRSGGGARGVSVTAARSTSP